MKNDKRLIIRLPSELLLLLKKLENRSQFIRDAVIEKLKKVKKVS